MSNQVTSGATSPASGRSTPRHRGFGSVYERPGRKGFYIQFHSDGRQIVRYGGLDKRQARKKLTAIQALLEAGTPLEGVMANVFGDFDGSRLTFREAVPLYLDYAKTRKRPSTFEGDTRRLNALAATPWAAEVLARVTPEAIHRWIAERQKTREVQRKRLRRPGESVAEFRRAKDRWEKHEDPGAANPTVNRDLALCSALYRWAIEVGHVHENPFRRVRRLPEKGRERNCYLTGSEARAFVASASPTLRPILVALLSTGMRRGELLALRWRSVDFERREILVEAATAKTQRPRSVPMSDDLYAVLRDLQGARKRPTLDGSDPVFCLRDGSAFTGWQLRKMFGVARDRCTGIPLDKRAVLRVHDCRHTAASLMVQARVPIYDVAKILGHSTLAVTMRYAHFSPEAARKAVSALGNSLALGASGVVQTKSAAERDAASPATRA